MPRLSRRSFLVASTALAANPALVTVARAAGDVDVAIVGAGAAGIAAARKIAAAGRKYALIEAAGHIGGRCVTDTRTFGVPYDRGAHWIHTPDINPIMKLTTRRGLEVYPAPPSQKVRIGRRYAREGELEDFLALQVRAKRSIAEATGKADLSCEDALPKDLGDWRSAVEFMFGPFTCGKDLTQMSAMDFAKSAERNSDMLCRQGFGRLLASFADGLAVKLSTPATAINIGRDVTVETPKGTISARTAIITVSTNAIMSGAIKFRPELPKRQLDAFAGLPLGSYDHVALEFADNPLDFENDDLVFEKSADARTAAVAGKVSGTSLCLIEIAGAFGRDLAAHGEAAMVNFAADWLAGLYGTDVKKAITRAHATRWNDEPGVLGAFSAATPGSQGARRILMEPVQNTVWFAGEAAHETLWGTVGGAWESGERAADAVLHRLGAVKESPAQPTTAFRPRPNGYGSERQEQGSYAQPNLMREEYR